MPKQLYDIHALPSFVMHAVMMDLFELLWLNIYSLKFSLCSSHQIPWTNFTICFWNSFRFYNHLPLYNCCDYIFKTIDWFHSIFVYLFELTCTWFESWNFFFFFFTQLIFFQTFMCILTQLIYSNQYTHSPLVCTIGTELRMWFILHLSLYLLQS